MVRMSECLRDRESCPVLQEMQPPYTNTGSKSANPACVETTSRTDPRGRQHQDPKSAISFTRARGYMARPFAAFSLH